MSAPSFPLSEAAVRHAWLQADKDHNAVIDRDELEDLLRSLRLPPMSRDQREQFFKQFDDLLTQDDFVRFVLARQAQLADIFIDIVAESNDHVSAAVFDHQDADEHARHFANLAAPRGAFGARELRRAADAAGVSLSDADVQNMMAYLDRDSNRSVDFDEFVGALLLVPSINPASVFESWRRSVWLESDADPSAPARELHLTRAEELRGWRGLLSRIAKDAACAGLAGAVAKTCTAPLDMLRMQILSSSVPVSIAEAVRRTRTHGGGWRAFFTGNAVNCTKAVPETAIRLLAFRELCQVWAADPNHITTTERLLMGGIAGGMSATATYPIEVARVRMMTTNSTTTGLFRTMLEQAHAHGTRSLFAGLSTALAAFIPFAAIDLTVNSSIREYASHELRARNISVPAVPLLLTAATVATSTAMFCTFPLTAVRVLQQASGQSTTSAIRALATQGPRGFFHGFGVSMLKSVPSAAISCVVFNLVQPWTRT